MGNGIDMQVVNNWDNPSRTGDEICQKFDQTSMTMCGVAVFSEMKMFCVSGKTLKTQDVKGDIM